MRAPLEFDERHGAAEAAFLAADVDGGLAFGVALGFSEELAGYGCGVALIEEKIAEQVHGRVALGPAEVVVRSFASGVAQEQRGDGVRDGGALGAQYPVAADLDTPDLEHVLELGWVGHVHLQKEYRGARGDVVVLALLALLCRVLAGLARTAAVRDEV